MYFTLSENMFLMISVIQKLIFLVVVKTSPFKMKTLCQQISNKFINR